MEFGGRYILAADRLAVWAALNDTSVLKTAIPGCSRIEWISPEELEAEITVNFGVVKPVFSGGLVLSDVHPAEKYRLSGKGKGGILGLAHGAADITLADHKEGTLLVFTAEGGASGRIMKLGRAVVGAGAQRVIDGFFLRFGEAMGAKVRPLGPPGDGSSTQLDLS